MPVSAEVLRRCRPYTQREKNADRGPRVTGCRGGVARGARRADPRIRGTGLLEPAEHVVLIEAEPTIVVLFAKELELVCVEVGDRERAARTQAAYQLADRVRGREHVMEYMFATP
jgi:hypothetical protein